MLRESNPNGCSCSTNRELQDSNNLVWFLELYSTRVPQLDPSCLLGIPACKAGEEDGELISPCKCSGGQRLWLNQHGISIIWWGGRFVGCLLIRVLSIPVWSLYLFMPLQSCDIANHSLCYPAAQVTAVATWNLSVRREVILSFEYHQSLPMQAELGPSALQQHGESSDLKRNAFAAIIVSAQVSCQSSLSISRHSLRNPFA